MTMPSALVRNGQLVAMTLRAAIWRKTTSPPVLGLGDLLFWCALSLAAETFASFVGAAPAPQFNLYGLNALVAWRAAALVACALFAPAPYRATVLSASLALSILFNLIVTVTPFLLALLPMANLQKVWRFEARYSDGALKGLYLLWWAGAIVALFRGSIPGRRLMQLSRAAGFVGVAAAITYVFPHLPVFEPPDFRLSSANIWEAQRAVAVAQARAGRPRLDPDRLALAQPALLDAAVQRLAPQREGIADIYVVGIAGFSREDVFIRELNGALGSLGNVLPIEGRVLRLVNHPSVVNVAPLATLQNFSAAIRAVGSVMNKREDILLLFMTSHGTQEGIALVMEDVAFATLRPDQVAGVLEAEGIRSRIVIVSACYSGVFIKPLAADDAIILTAADEHNPSFGCSNERDWTYFGDALFARSLQRGKPLEQAFEEAKQIVAGWEQQEQLTPSNPQGYFGAELVARLQPLYSKTDTPPWPGAMMRPAPWPAPPSAKSGDGIWGPQPAMPASRPD